MRVRRGHSKSQYPRNAHCSMFHAPPPTPGVAPTGGTNTGHGTSSMTGQSANCDSHLGKRFGNKQGS